MSIYFVVPLSRKIESLIVGKNQEANTLFLDFHSLALINIRIF